MKAVLQIIVVAAIVAAALWVGRFAQESDLIKDLVSRYGYGGIFLISVISGFNLAVPIPPVSFLPLFLVSGLNFWLIILIITAGITVADSVAYLLGKTGRLLLLSSTENSFLNRLERLRSHYYWAPLLALFLFVALVPLPNEVIVIPLAFLGYQLTRLLPLLFVGNVIFNTLSALGIINLFKVI